MVVRQLLVASVLALIAHHCEAQGFPTRPIKVIVPWPTGQATDVVARLVAEKMSEQLGQPLVIDNRPGAGGTVGTEHASKAQPDGYTILAGSSGPISISPYVQRVAYDPERDFQPICLLALDPYVLVVHPSVPATSVADFVGLMRSNPGKYTYSSSGIGTTSHLVIELFNAAAKVTATHIPYKGSAPAITDLIGGHVQYTIETVTAVLPHVQAGRLKALGVSSAKPAIALPQIPTIAETPGMQGFDVRAWIALLVPAAVPAEIRGRLASSCNSALEGADMNARFLAAGLEPALGAVGDLSAFLKQQSEGYAATARRANIKLE